MAIREGRSEGVGDPRGQLPPPTAAQVDTWIRDSGLAPLPTFATAEQFLAAVALRRSRAISLRPTRGLPAAICGVWVHGDDTDTVLVAESLTGFRRELVVLHEAAHVLLGHHGAWEEGQMPRRRFAANQEWQAEWLATFLLTRTRGLHRGAWIGQESTRRAARLLAG